MDQTPVQRSSHSTASLGEGDSGSSSREQPPLASSSSYLSVIPNTLEPVYHPGFRALRSASPTVYDSSDSAYELSPVGSFLSSDGNGPLSPLSPPPKFTHSLPLRRHRERDDYFPSSSQDIDTAPRDVVVANVPSITDYEHQESPMRCGEQFRYPIPPPANDPWEIANDFVKESDKAMCNSWKEQIDKQLFFAGLFASTVVAFLMVSYQFLQPSPMDVQKANYALFLTLFHELQTNGTIAAISYLELAPSPNNYHPPPAVLRMNAAWFLSMTLALTTVLTGTICLQWLQEYERDPRLNPKQAFALRQMRWDGLQYWKVPLIISSLTMLLQLALLLFFWGLLEFLWSLNSAVTMINSVVIGIVLFFMTATICVPALQTVFLGGGGSGQLGGYQAPYKSPQARVVAIAAVWVALKVVLVLQFLFGNGNGGRDHRGRRRRREKREFLEEKRKFLERISKARSWEDWMLFDNEWQKSRMVDLQQGDPSRGPLLVESFDIPRGLARLGNTYIHNQDGIYGLYHLLRKVHPMTSSRTLQKLTRTSGESSGLLHHHLPGSALILMDVNYRDILADLHSAAFLGHVVRSGQDPMQEGAMRVHRCELYIRIANYGAGCFEPFDGPWGSISISVPLHQQDEMGRFVNKFLSEKDCGINPFVENEGYLDLPENLKCELIGVFRKFLDNTRVLHDSLWEIVKPMVVDVVNNKEAPPDKHLVEEIVSLNAALLDHYRSNRIFLPPPGRPRSPSHRTDNDIPRAPNTSSTQDTPNQLSSEQKRVVEYVMAIKDGGKLGRTFTISAFTQTFQPLERACCGRY